MAGDTVEKRASANTTATDIAFDRMQAALDEVGHRHRHYPGDTVFIPSDLPDFREVFTRHMRDEKPVVVIYPDGRERMVFPGEPARVGTYLWRTFRHRARSYAAWRFRA